MVPASGLLAWHDGLTRHPGGCAEGEAIQNFVHVGAWPREVPNRSAAAFGVQRFVRDDG
jgi:hypothetical protein